MTFDPKTSTISIGPNSDFLADSGEMYITELRQDAAHAEAPTSIKNDWETIRQWLGCVDGELTAANSAKISDAWKAYYAIGLAPSLQLQAVFDEISRQYRHRGTSFDRPPTNVMDVFDRLMANDGDIAAKRAHDIRAEHAQFDPLFHALKRDKPVGWWRERSPLFRAWAFGCFVWAIGTVLYTAVFDPFQVYGWENMGDEEYAKLGLLVALPSAAGAVSYVYNRWVR